MLLGGTIAFTDTVTQHIAFMDMLSWVENVILQGNKNTPFLETQLECIFKNLWMEGNSKLNKTIILSDFRTICLEETIWIV